MDLLKTTRVKHGLNKVEMARKLGIAKSYYTMLEKGERCISKNIGIKLHEHFGIPLEDIFLQAQVHDEETNSSNCEINSQRIAG